jgi:hypothetical protein
MERLPRHVTVQRLGRTELVALLASFSDQTLSELDVERRLLTFCLNCPDPAGAMDIVLEAPPGSSDERTVDEALSLPARRVAALPTRELAADHPLRHWRLAE